MLNVYKFKYNSLSLLSPQRKEEAVKFKPLNLCKALWVAYQEPREERVTGSQCVCVTVCRDILRRSGAWEISSIHSQGSTPNDEQKVLLSKRLKTS